MKLISFFKIPASLVEDVKDRLTDNPIAPGVDIDVNALAHELIYYAWLHHHGYIRVDKEGEDLYTSYYIDQTNIDLEHFQEKHGMIDPYYFHQKYYMSDFAGELEEILPLQKYYQDIMDEIYGNLSRHRTLRTVFDPGSSEWNDTTIPQKVEILQKILATGDITFDRLLFQYKSFYRYGLADKEYVADAVEDALVILLNYKLNQSEKKPEVI